MRKSMVLGTLVALGLGGQATAADGFSYSYLEAAYVNTELDDFDTEGDGFDITGSIAFGERFFGFAGYGQQDFDFGLDGETMEVGAGLHWPLNNKLDIVTRASYVDAEFDGNGFSGSDDGYGLGLGLRSRPMEVIELTGDVNYVDFGGNNDSTTLAVGGRYYFTKQLAAGVNLGFNDDGTTWGLGARFDFGTR